MSGVDGENDPNKRSRSSISISVRNSSTFSLLSLEVQYALQGESNTRHSFPNIRVVMLERQTRELRNNNVRNDGEGQWILILRKWGAMFANMLDHPHWTVTRHGNLYLELKGLREGDEIELVNDPEVPILTTEDVRYIAIQGQRKMEELECLEPTQEGLWLASIRRQVFLQTIKTMDKFKACSEAQFEAVFNVFDQNDEVEHMITDWGTIWEDHYHPLQVASHSSPEFVRRITRESHPLLLQVYFRSLFLNVQHIHQHEMVRYHFDLYPDEADGGRDIRTVAQVHRYSQWQTYGNHGLAGPIEPERLNDGDYEDEGAPGDIYGTLSGLLSTFNDANIQGGSADMNRETLIPLNDDKWDSVEVILFARQWYPEIHPSTSQSFRDQTMQLLLINNRQDDAIRLNTECLHLIIRCLYEEEAETSPAPILRAHHRVDHQGMTPSEHSYNLVTGVTSVIGMGTPRQWLGVSNDDDDGEETPGCLAREDCYHLFHWAPRDGGWSVDGDFLPPLVFRFFDPIKY